MTDLRGKYVIVRANSAGVFAGEFVDKENDAVELKNMRRIWYWEGAASLSQLAESGTSKPNECKFPEVVSGPVILQNVIEIICCTEKAKISIEGVPVWKK